MNRLGLALAFLIVVLFAWPAFAGDTYVKGYFRRDGTYVRPHHRSTPDGNPWNNYGTKGNINPYTGKKGYVDPYNANSRRGYGSGYGYGGSLYGPSNRSGSSRSLWQE